MKLAILAGVALVPLFAGFGLAQEGACCIPPCMDCFIMTQQQCDSLGGVYAGDGTTCDPNP